MTIRCESSSFGFSCTRLVIVSEADDRQDVDGALVKLAPVLDVATREGFDRTGAVADLMRRGAVAVRWAPVLRGAEIAEQDVTPVEAEIELMVAVASWVRGSDCSTDMVEDVLAEIEDVLTHAGVSG